MTDTSLLLSTTPAGGVASFDDLGAEPGEDRIWGGEEAQLGYVSIESTFPNFSFFQGN